MDINKDQKSNRGEISIVNNSERSTYRDLLIIVSVLVVIYLTDSLLFATNSNNLFRVTKRIAPIILSGIMTMSYLLNRKTLRKVDIHMIFISMSIIASMLLAGRLFDGFFYIAQVASLVFGLQYSHRFSLEEFATKYVAIMKIIAITSLVVFLLRDVFLSFSFLPVIKNTVGVSFSSVFFTNLPLSTSLARRNWGPFWEPGTYQVYLNIALYFTMFITKKNIIRNATLFCLTLLTTLSGAAILPMVFIILAYLIEEKSRKSVLIFSVISLSLIILIETGRYDEILIKMTGFNEHSSMLYRLSTIISGIKSTLMNPLFGSSPETQDLLRAEITYQLGNRASSGNTNTFISFFSFYGVIVGSYLTNRLWKFSKINKKSVLASILVFIALLASTSNENLTASLLIAVLLFIRSDKQIIDMEGGKVEDSSD